MHSVSKGIAEGIGLTSWQNFLQTGRTVSESVAENIMTCFWKWVCLKMACTSRRMSAFTRTRCTKCPQVDCTVMADIGTQMIVNEKERDMRIEPQHEVQDPQIENDEWRL